MRSGSVFRRIFSSEITIGLISHPIFRIQAGQSKARFVVFAWHQVTGDGMEE